MPKIAITGALGKREYEGTYAYGTVIKIEKTGHVTVNSYDEPANWEKGMGQFFVAMQALRNIAAMEGNENFKIAARDAIAAILAVEHNSQKSQTVLVPEEIEIAKGGE